MRRAKILNVLIYIIIILFYFTIRFIFSSNHTGISEPDFKTICISSSNFPLEIIKETVINTLFLPTYYFFIHFLKNISENEVIFRLFNCFISFITLFFVILSIKKLIKNKNCILYALFCGIFLSSSHFFYYYTNSISPYCIHFLTESLVILSLICYLQKNNDKNLIMLLIADLICIFSNSNGYLFVLSQIIVLNLIKKEKNIKAQTILSKYSLIAILIIFPFILAQYIISTNLLITDNINKIDLNFDSFFLTINELTTPYLSFEAPDYQTKSTLGMLYGLFLNKSFNINSLKIILTIIFASVIPILTTLYLTIKCYKKNPIIRIITKTTLLYSLLILIIISLNKSGIIPVYFTPLFLGILINITCGLYYIKDIFIKITIAFCLIAIQYINPSAETFNVTIKKNHNTLKCIDLFIKDFNITKTDFIIMPYLGQYAKLYYKNLAFMDFDYEMLKTKNKIINNLISKNAKTINKKNIHFLMQPYLNEKTPNEYINKYFIENYDKKGQEFNNIILIIDKKNSKTVSKQSILKCSTDTQYNPKLKKISFKNPNTPQNQAKTLFDSIKTKTLYNILDILIQNFYLKEIVEYKKINDKYYKLNTNKNNLIDAINSAESDYIFIIFKKL